MKTLILNDFFNRIKYDWKKDKDIISDICFFTKTRVLNKNKFELTWGMEQPFLIKSLADYIKAKGFFEIGTGRGTACYTVSLSENIQDIISFDIIPFSKKQKTSIGYQEVFASNSDIYKMILNCPKKTLIKFELRNNFKNFTKSYKKYDLVFIDGNHNDYNIIKEDFEIATKVVSKNGLILFDDYAKKFAVKKVVDDLLKENSDLHAILVPFRGYLFNDRPKEVNEGMVILSKKELF